MIKIDAKNKPLGRLASEVSTFLIGKHKANFVPYKITGDAVEVTNVKQLAITGNKLENKEYFKHTGYIGHGRITKMKTFSKEELLKKAIWNMLPKNKLRKERMKLLTIG